MEDIKRKKEYSIYIKSFILIIGNKELICLIHIHDESFWVKLYHGLNDFLKISTFNSWKFIFNNQDNFSYAISVTVMRFDYYEFKTQLNIRYIFLKEELVWSCD